MVKRYTLHKKEIQAKRYLAMVFEYWGRNRYGLKSRYAGGSPPHSVCGFPFEDRYIRSIYDEGVLRVTWCYWTVSDEVLAHQDAGVKLRLVGSPYLTIEFPRLP